MKSQFRRLFAFILTPLESGNDPFAYKPSHRVALLILSTLFSILASIVFVMGQGEDPTYLLPVVLFGGIGVLGWIVGTLGNERAVSKIWGSR
ncbi:hypothetical protein A9Q99_24895 [Gammaproteobacteria bacterium 45_16_T64]|nr:hypothetical protein A9Q99_24895 [Gammaproteobacteria bacterium 45_16_T64]